MVLLIIDDMSEIQNLGETAAADGDDRNVQKEVMCLYTNLQ